jgi:hypothetical protein
MTSTLTPDHLTQLVKDSGIALDVVQESGCRSLTARDALTALPPCGFSAPVCKLGAGLLLRLTLPDDPAPLYQFRPDHPRQGDDGELIKYEIPRKRPQRLIVHPRSVAALRTGDGPVWITEGAKKLYSLVSREATALAGIGVWSFTVTRTAAEKRHGAPKVLLPDWTLVQLAERPIVIVFDSDAALNTDVDRAEQELAALLRARGAHVQRVRLPAQPDGRKQGVDDFFARGHALADLEALIEPMPRLRFATISAVDLYHKQLDPIYFVIPGKLPAGATLFVGRGKDGKSLMAWNLAVATVTGGKALGAFAVQPGEVLYLALEDGERRAQKRLFDQMDDAGMTAPPLGMELVTWEVPRLGEGFMERLETWADEHPRGRLVIVDILEKVRPARTTHGIYTDDYHALSALQQFGQQRNMAILVVHHSNKTKPDDFRDTASGSTGLTGACDTFWSLHRIAGDPHATLKMIGRDIEQQDLALKFQDGFWSVLGEAGTDQMSPERHEILDVLARSTDPLTPKQVADVLAKNVNTTKLLLRKMALAGVVHQPKYGYYGSLPVPGTMPSSTINSVNSINADNSINSVNSVYNSLENQGVTEEFTASARVYGTSDPVNSLQPTDNIDVAGTKEQEFTEFMVEHTHGTLPEATLAPCVHCQGTVFWHNAGNQPVCQRCHPPSS